jgi:16S rRNA (guanine966-N2)-methyltransferase
MRVISGKYKGKRFSPPKRFPSRPTTDMAKEALFGIIDAKVYFEDLEILDLFSGTGNISLEFLSRGVGKVIGVDSSGISCNFQKKIATELDITNWIILKQDAFHFLTENARQFDIVFADPPFEFPDLEKLTELVFQANCLVEDGLFILEHSERMDVSTFKYYKNTRHYGGVSFSFFEQN